MPQYMIETANVQWRYYQAVCHVGEYYMKTTVPIEANDYDCVESDAADQLMAHIINATPYNARYNTNSMFHL